MTAMLPLNLLFLVLLSEFLQVHGTSIPILRSHHSHTEEWPSNMCTTNMTIPTVSEECIPSCSTMQRAQTICRDNTLCMCSIARSPDLEACFDCILEGIGTFVDSIPHYIESLQHQTSGRSWRSWPTPFLILYIYIYLTYASSSLYCLL